MRAIPRIYRGASAAAGALVYLHRTPRVASGEWVVIRVPGQGDRRGQVIDAGEEVSVVQILEETVGLPPARVEITLTGTAATAVVGRDLLGRVLSGTGAPVDGLPPPLGEAVRPIWAAPLNPARRARPGEFIETGISAIDGMNTLVRGQKLPVFSGPGLPGLELAGLIVEGARDPGGEPFAVIFVGIGITAREADLFLGRIQQSGVQERTVVYLNQARDPAIERLLAPRIALAQAEFLAFECATHVLVVMADMTHYCEALREIATAREETPGRRGYPGYMYTDLAGLYERAGVILGRLGSVTQIPVLTMPDDDVTHPIPDLTGYITEGQLVLSRELHREGVFPPIDVLPSLSRLMNSGIGEGKTGREHRELADQLYASYSRGREARLMAAIVGEAGLSEADRRAIAFAREFERRFVCQGAVRRSISETLELAWELLAGLPREDLLRVSDSTLEARQRLRGTARG
ncbi:MAG: V-type ATP synthase subunit B [Gemmatimonadales bacterium]|nr:MAG: V-type ATP synthase subunit B [Gemmatimonadales bacterium]